ISARGLHGRAGDDFPKRRRTVKTSVVDSALDCGNRSSLPASSCAIATGADTTALADLHRCGRIPYVGAALALTLLLVGSRGWAQTVRLTTGCSATALRVGSNSQIQANPGFEPCNADEQGGEETTTIVPPL